MGKTQSKLIILSCILALTCLAVYWPVDKEGVGKKESLKSVLGDIPGYRLMNFHSLSEVNANMLNLDDYIQARYHGQNEQDTVDLYVGYYFSLEKLNAPHHPLVCFPSQGWQVTKPSIGRIAIGDDVIAYSMIEATLGGQKLLVIYWFQSGKKTALNIRRNKLNAVYNKFSGRGGEHAFVRLVIPLRTDYKKSAEVGERFIKSFYPAFIRYVEQ